MRGGDLDRRIRIEVNAPTRSGSGAEIDAFTLFAAVAARRMDARGREFFGSDRVTGEAVTVWRIRFLAGVKSAMRIIETKDGIAVANEEWDIQFTQEFGGRDEGLDIACIRRPA